MEFEDYVNFLDGEATLEAPDDITDDPIVDVDPNDDDPNPNDDITDDDPIEEINLTTEEITNYYNQVRQLGVLNVPDDFEFDGSVEKMDEAVALTRQRLIDEARAELQDTLPEDFRALLDYAKAGGRDLNAYINAYAPKNTDNLDLSKLDDQRQVLYDYYKEATSFDDEKINRLIDRLEEKGDLEEEAKTTVSELVQIREQRKQNLVAQAEQQAQAIRAQEEQEKANIYNAIDTRVTDKTRAAQIKNFVYQPVTTKEGQTTKLNQVIQAISSNPEHFTQLADLLYDYDPKKGINLTKVEKEVRAQGVKSFKELVQEKVKPVPSAGGKIIKSQASPIDWEAFTNT